MSNEKLREKLIDMCNCYGIGNARTTLDKVMSKEKDPKLIGDYTVYSLSTIYSE